MTRFLPTAVLVLLAAPTFAADPFGLPEATPDCRPWTRWWWLGSAVDPPNLTRSLEELNAAGFGGVEICPIYGAKGAEDRFIEFLSPKWMGMLAHTTAEGKRLNFGVDMTTGTGWPFGGPNVSADDASAKAMFKTYDVASGTKLATELPKGKPRAVVAAAGENRIDLMPFVKDGRLDWTAPNGVWKVYAVLQQGPVMAVKRAAPGGVGSVLDPFSPAKLDRYLGRFDRAFADYRGAMPRAHFHDSYEYYQASWTDDLLAEFRKRRGYDLTTRLPELSGEGPPELVARVKCDYRETISDLHREYVARWTEWCHKHGGLSRNQAHGGPGNIIDAYAAADIPECEIYAAFGDRHRPFLKMASSAAHLSGRPLTSAESFTWLAEHFQTSLAKTKTAADYLFLAGVNHLVYHGMPYSPADATWPGWQFYASVNFGPGGGLWRDLPAFNAYVARCQAVLRAGRPDNDVLLYVPFHDAWQKPNGLLQDFGAPGSWMEPFPVHRVAMALEERGYGYDEISDRLLDQATVEGGRVKLGGNPYRAVVVPAVTAMPVATTKKLAALARSGATVVFAGPLPKDVPGFADLEARRGELRDALKELPATVLIGDDVGALLHEAHVPREPVAELGVRFIRRAVADGHMYFLVNRGSTAMDGWVTLGTSAAAAALLDPLTPDRAGKAAFRRGPAGEPQVYLQLAPGESRVLKAFRADVSGPAWRYAKPAGEPVPVAGSWKVEFIDGGPVLPAGYETSELTSWADRDDPEAKRFAGTARYTIAFERPAGVAADFWLDLGRVAESARVAVNDKPVGTLFCPPYRVSVGEYLRSGRNTLTVEVTNLAANRVADLDRRKVNWKHFYDANLANHPTSGKRGVLDASGWPVVASGLLGPVRLVPVGTKP